MLEALFMSVMGSFIYDNITFFKTQINNMNKVTDGNMIGKIEIKMFQQYLCNMKMVQKR